MGSKETGSADLPEMQIRLLGQGKEGGGMTEIELFDKITAVFSPRRTDDLIPAAEAWIGRKAVWEAYFVIEKGPYKGEWAMVLEGTDRLEAPFAYVPLGDLLIDK